MTTYPLSEPATIRRVGESGKALSVADGVVARGSLADCVDLLDGWSAVERSRVRIDVDDMDLYYDSEEIETLLFYLRNESTGLSNQEISEIADPDH